MNPQNDHKRVLVPIETWEFNSPYLKFSGRNADIGLFAEAFIYYEKVFVYVNTVKEFEEFIEFFAKANKVDQLIELINNKIINFFYYSFMSTAINNQGVFSIWNMQFNKENSQSDFIRLVVNKSNLPISSKRRQKLWQAIVSNLIDEESTDYQSPVLDAKKAMKDNKKCAILIQTYIDNLYKNLELGPPPEVNCQIMDTAADRWNIKTNLNFGDLNKLASNKLGFRPEMPLIGEVQSNRLIWTGLKYGFDLSLGDVMSQVVGNKLYEAEEKMDKTKVTLDNLKSKVEFPDIRKLVNEDTISVEDIFNIRIHADKFRNWLQQEGERDRDAIIAYHNEVSKSSGITKKISGTLKIFGKLTQLAPAAYPLATKDLSLASNLAVSGAGLVTAEFLDRIANSMNKEWRPVVFGEWLKEEVKKNKQPL